MEPLEKAKEKTKIKEVTENLVDLQFGNKE
jgi:hypothetical protein